MANRMAVTCFTDLENSTGLTEGLGNNEFLKHVQEHLRVAEVLAEHVGGKYVKNAGDANVVTFDDLEAGLRFAVCLQQYYAQQPCVSQPPVRVRIGLSLGVVQPSQADFFGSGMNRAARVQSIAAPGEVLVNADLRAAVTRAWGPEKTAAYFTSAGEHSLKGITEPQRQELFQFQWQDYASRCPESALAQLVHDHLAAGRVEPSNVHTGDLADPHTIIWPVVPRTIVTAIHRGQAEIIRVVARLGWKVHLLIADCGARTYDRDYCDAFCRRLSDYSLVRGFTVAETTFSSALFAPGHAGYALTQDLFRRISAHLTLADMLRINNKSYEDAIQIDDATPTLDFLRPAITMACVLYLAEQDEGKCLVVAGLDERDQWSFAYSLTTTTRSRLGVLMNPMLKTSSSQYRKRSSFQYRQKDDQPIWNSLPELVASMKKGNLAWWSYHMHAYLPSFPSRSVCVGERHIAPQDWLREDRLPCGLTADALAECCWCLLDPNLRP